MVDYLAQVTGLDAKQEKERKDIDTLTASMRPLAETSEGTFALQDLLANQEAPKTQRAAAAQALNPAFKAAIGAHGELSFSAAPGASLGYTLPDPVHQEKATVFGKVASGAQTDIISQFDTTFRSLQASQDLVEVENTYAQLNAGASNFIAAKEMEIRNRVRTSLGVTQLESQVAADKQLDTDFYNKEFGMGYQGPTDESLKNLQMLRTEEAKVDDMVAKELGSNPEVIALKTRMQGVEVLVSQKRSISGNEMADKSTSAGSTVIPERTNAAMLAMGLDPNNQQARATINKQLETGNGPAVMAEQIASMSTIQLLGVSATDTPEAKQASNVLSSKFSNPADVDYLKTQVKNFDYIYGPNLTEDERAMFAPAATSMIQGAEAKKAEAATIQAKKVEYVLNKFQTMRTNEFATRLGNVGEAGGWDAPTDPLLAELPLVVKDIKTADPKATIDITKIASRMDWSQNRAAKQKALAEYAYGQALKEVNNNALGLPTGYHSVDAIMGPIQAQIVSATDKARRREILAGRYGLNAEQITPVRN